MGNASSSNASSSDPVQTCKAQFRAAPTLPPPQAPFPAGCSSVVGFWGGAHVAEGQLQPAIRQESLTGWGSSAARLLEAEEIHAPTNVHMHGGQRHGSCINVSAALDERPMSRKEVVDCLSGMHIFIGGNSISRHWAFALSEYIKGITVYNTIPGSSPHAYRKEEQTRCGGPLTPGREGDALACQLMAGNHTTITYGTEQSLDSPTLSRVWGDGTRPPDIAVLHAGTNDLFVTSKKACWESMQALAASKLASTLVRASKRTPHLYWRTSTAMCDGGTLNCAIAASNNLVANALCHRHVVPHLRILDGWAWTDGRCGEYSDVIHHPKLALQHVRTLVADVCSRRRRGTGLSTGLS